MVTGAQKATLLDALNGTNLEFSSALTIWVDALVVLRGEEVKMPARVALVLASRLAAGESGESVAEAADWILAEIARLRRADDELRVTLAQSAGKSTWSNLAGQLRRAGGCGGDAEGDEPDSVLAHRG